MKSKAAFIIKILMLIPLGISLSAFQAQGGNGPENPQANATQASAPPGAQEILRVSEGKSFVLNTSETIKRVSVTNSDIAQAMVVSPNQVLVHGVKPGTVSFLIWNEEEQVRTFDLQVLAVPISLEPVRESLAEALPDQDIRVSQSGSSIVLTGTVASKDVAEQAAAIAKTANDKVVNLLAVAPMNQAVMLEVKFAEVNRNALRQLGLTILSTGAANTPGVISTQQFSGVGNNVDLTSSIGGSVRGFTTQYNLTDLLNIFVFRPDLNLGLLVKALQQKSMLQTLAEPNLIAMEGKEASFLAGGEFPVPVVQGTGTGNNSSVSIQFKEFGVRLRFIANPNPDGSINLHVAPEVSALDYTNAVTLSGFLIPALSTRKAETDVQLKDGQSFAVAGLLDNRVTKISGKVPWLGDVPILGNLFKSSNFVQAKTELLVMVTPHMVKPLEPGQRNPLPKFPVPFMDNDKFDNKAGKASEPKSLRPGG
ncbi:MAG TPA: type II and III secretion system protein family protein [Acidobacteriota bacterium]|nr:type II and III secretion system protein family protein [Acidobacteriota bacterium]